MIDPPARADALVLGYANLAEPAIAEGIRRLAEVLERPSREGACAMTDTRHATRHPSHGRTARRPTPVPGRRLPAALALRVSQHEPRRRERARSAACRGRDRWRRSLRQAHAGRDLPSRRHRCAHAGVGRRGRRRPVRALRARLGQGQATAQRPARAARTVHRPRPPLGAPLEASARVLAAERSRAPSRCWSVATDWGGRCSSAPWT